MKRLLDEGADGYYIKESPDFNFPDSFSEQNYDEFKKCIEDCVITSYSIHYTKLYDMLWQQINTLQLDIMP